MTLFALAYCAGVLTIVSPCILPILPFVLTHVGWPFRRSGLPMLMGMALAFAAVASLAAVAGGWAIALNQHGRTFALVLFALFGLGLLFPALAALMATPLVKIGALLSRSVVPTDGQAGASLGASALLGIATGLLWAPCAGPVLGLILTGAALGGPSLETSILLLAYAAGAATSLAAALIFGNRALDPLKRSLRFGDSLRRALGLAVLASVVAIGLGLDTGVLTRISSAGTTAIEQRLISSLSPVVAQAKGGVAPGTTGQPEDSQPLFDATLWLNTAPLTSGSIKGKVVLVNFWTYSCINCLRSLPYVRAWAEKYRDQGLVVIGVHTPEFAFEKDVGNVRKAAASLGVDYPVAIDNDYAIWRAFKNRAWPARYFIDTKGRMRHYEFGEGDYVKSERVIQTLLAETGSFVDGRTARVVADGVQGAPDLAQLRSPETYLGYARSRGLVAPGAKQDRPALYTAPADLRLNQWSLSGIWTLNSEYAALNEAGGRIRYRFHARDVHLVMGPSPNGKPVRFRVTIDGIAPGNGHGSDMNPDGTGVIDGERLYQLLRQVGPVVEHVFEIEFLDPGARAYAFTFG